MVGWWVGGLAGWRVGGWVGWLVGELVGRWFGWLVGSWSSDGEGQGTTAGTSVNHTAKHSDCPSHRSRREHGGRQTE